VSISQSAYQLTITSTIRDIKVINIDVDIHKSSPSLAISETPKWRLIFEKQCHEMVETRIDRTGLIQFYVFKLCGFDHFTQTPQIRPIQMMGGVYVS
jgi:hypothetical protein